MTGGNQTSEHGAHEVLLLARVEDLLPVEDTRYRHLLKGVFLLNANFKLTGEQLHQIRNLMTNGVTSPELTE
jgi:hypothetical protein